MIWLDNVACAGTETLLTDCRASSIGINTCTHAQDAGVRCLGSTPPGTNYYNYSMQHVLAIMLHIIDRCQNGDVRLVDGSIEMEGRVEVCYAEEYGTVCGNGFNIRAASVVCRQLGYSSQQGKYKYTF